MSVANKNVPLATALKNHQTRRNSERVTNLNQRLLTEFQSLIAFACYDSPSISHGGESAMTEASMEKIMSNLYFGNDHETNNADSGVCYVDQFLLGLNKFQGLYKAGPAGASHVMVSLLLPVVSSHQQTGGSGRASGIDKTLVLNMLPMLHRQGKCINIFVGEGSIEKGLLSRKSLRKDHAQIRGRTLLRLAKEVLSNCKNAGFGDFP